MPPRVSPQIGQRLFSTTTRTRTTLPSSFHSYTAPAQQPPATPKLGKIGRWYLPSMALIALGFAIANALEEHNLSKRQTMQMTQDQRNRMLLDAYGARSSLEDMERAINFSGEESGADRHHALNEAYGERKSIGDVQRAMQVYEVL